MRPFIQGCSCQIDRIIFYPTCHAGRRARRLGSGQAVLLQLAVHRSLPDPQDAGGLLAVTADLLQGSLDENLLHLLEGHPQQGMNIGRGPLFTLVNILRQIIQSLQ